MSDEQLHLYTIYTYPSDFPETPFVVRGWLVGPAGQITASGELGFGDTLEEVRRMVPAGLVLLPREDTDERQIVETWL